MRLFTFTVFVFSMISSWLVVDVLACENDNMVIFKRTPAGKNERKPSKSAGKSSAQCSGIPPWMSIKVKKQIPSSSGQVMILDGAYLREINPAVKIIYPKNEVEMQTIYTEVSNLQQVKQYLGGWTMMFKEKRVVFIMMPNMGDALKNTPGDEAKGKTITHYVTKYNMLHMDSYDTKNYVQKPGETDPKLVDWGYARYGKMPPPQINDKFCPDEALPSPPLPKIPKIQEIAAKTTSPSRWESLILKSKPTLLWGNNEANYYKMVISGASLALKVSWIVGPRQHQSLLTEISNMIKVRQFIAAGTLYIGKSNERLQYISYLVIDFPGEMEKPGETDKLLWQKEAISRYENDYGMTNTHTDLEKYFIYNKAEKKAYIFDWSSARHVDLPQANLVEICSPTEKMMQMLDKDAFMKKLEETPTPSKD